MASTVIPYHDYRRRVFGCWLGKSIGGTLGGPWEGRTPPYELTFYDPVPTAMLENDDLDLQLVWLARLRDGGLPITEEVFARGWREHIHAWPDEYGVCWRNLDLGLQPPLSGSHDNGFTAGMGAAIRTELWAGMAPGDPALARHLARADARCDHSGEGVWAAEFIATIESLAFVEQDRGRLIAAGLAAIPAGCRVAGAVRCAQESWAATRDRRAAFARLDAAHGSQNFTDVAINLGIIVLGWCVGEGDFGAALLAAVNCGYDADCTCATLGAILGLIDPDGIDQRWRQPIGEAIALGRYITGITPPATIAELTDHTAELAGRALHAYGSAVTLSGAPAADQPERLPATACRRLRDLEVGDQAAVLAVHPVHLALTYPPGVRVRPGAPAALRLTATSTAERPLRVALAVRAPQGWSCTGAACAERTLAAGEALALDVTLATGERPWRPCSVDLGLVLAVDGVARELQAGLLMTIPYRTWTVDGLPEAEPPCPAGAALGEAAGHEFELAPHAVPGRTTVVRLEVKDLMSREALRRLVVQAPGQVRVWCEGERVLDHDGTWHVPALHRSGASVRDLALPSPARLTIAVAGGAPGALFHAVGEARGNCNRWASRLEYRIPAAG